MTDYDPFSDTISTVTSTFIPLFLVALYNGFENDKKHYLTYINIFDDFIINLSFILPPLIPATKAFKGFSMFGKVFMCISFSTFLVSLFFQIQTLRIMKDVLYLQIVSEDHTNNYFTAVYTFHVGKFCVDNYGFNRCKALQILTYMIMLLVTPLLFVRFIFNSRWIKITIFTIFIIYSAISSGYLLSDTPVITQSIFSISTITLTRIFEHFNDKHENIKTFFSIYLNYNKIFGEIWNEVENLEEVLENLKKIANRVDAKIKRRVDYVKEALENLVKETKDIVELKNEKKKVEEIIKTLDCQIERMADIIVALTEKDYQKKWIRMIRDNSFGISKEDNIDEKKHEVEDITKNQGNYENYENIKNQKNELKIQADMLREIKNNLNKLNNKDNSQC
ncbi:12349_t:CDS:2 [Acaulospora morrowiae]|uniref:12349_t:CDS:1 n=1 Tax=Acaulospora morrowiae TaxID=94023 RepID=A0A9N9AEP6_9GLOM|nr:12349_t:CDS:2 [Acaulospora morrowiae]